MCGVHPIDLCKGGRFPPTPKVKTKRERRGRVQYDRHKTGLLRFVEYRPKPSPPRQLAARAGIEPMLRFLEACAVAISSESAKTADAQLGAQELSSLTKIIAAWPKLSGEFRAAVLAVTQSATS